MASPTLLSEEEKLRLLKTIESDVEFRYAIAGALGISAILDELRRLREDFNKRFEEVNKRLEEHGKILAEHSKRLEEQGKRLEEHSKRLEELTKALEEQGRRLEEFGRRLEEQGRRLEENSRRLEELTKVVGELKVGVGSLGRRLGRDLEKTILKLYERFLAERGVEAERVEKFVYRDVDGRFYRRGARIEVDVYLHDKAMYLIEVKSYADHEDIEWFYEKAHIVEKILGKKANKLIVVAVDVDKSALERAEELGVDVVYGNVIEE